MNTQQKIMHIKDHADIVSASVCGKEFNRIAISSDDYDFLLALIGQENPFNHTGVDQVEIDYHGEFLPLIEGAEIAEEQLRIEKDEINAFKAANHCFDDPDENYYHG